MLGFKTVHAQRDYLVEKQYKGKSEHSNICHESTWVNKNIFYLAHEASLLK